MPHTPLPLRFYYTSLHTESKHFSSPFITCLRRFYLPATPALVPHTIGVSPSPNQRPPSILTDPESAFEPRHKVAYCCLSSLTFASPTFTSFTPLPLSPRLFLLPNES